MTDPTAARAEIARLFLRRLECARGTPEHNEVKRRLYALRYGASIPLMLMAPEPRS